MVAIYEYSLLTTYNHYGYTFQARTKAQAEKIEELDAKARKYEQEVESQRHLVSSKSKEVERLQSLLELTEAKHQNSLRQLESKLRIEIGRASCRERV